MGMLAGIRGNLDQRTSCNLLTSREVLEMGIFTYDSRRYIKVFGPNVFVYKGFFLKYRCWGNILSFEGINTLVYENILVISAFVYEPVRVSIRTGIKM